MCGRYTLTKSGADLWDFIEGTVPPEQVDDLRDCRGQLEIWDTDRRRFNIVPGSYEPILFHDQGRLQIRNSHWWLLPNWAGNQVRWRISKAGEKTFTWQGERKSHFNSRWDTISNPGNRYWNGLLETRRCLIPADGFVEWPDETMLAKGQEKIPKYFFLKNRSPFYFAGLFETLPDDTGAPFTSFNVITVKPNSLLEALPHHRMPAILGPENIAKWINPSTKAEEAANLLAPLSTEAMGAHFLSKLVNVPKNESPQVLEPLRSDG